MEETGAGGPPEERVLVGGEAGDRAPSPPRTEEKGCREKGGLHTVPGS